MGSIKKLFGGAESCILVRLLPDHEYLGVFSCNWCFSTNRIQVYNSCIQGILDLQLPSVVIKMFV